MPQIDFGKALSNGEASPRQGKIRLGAPSPDELATGSSWFARHRPGLPEWANIIFTTVAITGGLFCAFYFFNGTDVVRSARHWPRQYFYARPVPFNENGSASLAASARLRDSSVKGNSAKASGRPFSHPDQRITSNQSPHSIPIGSFAPLDSSSPVSQSGGNSASANPGSALPSLRQPAPTGNSVAQNVRTGSTALRSTGRASRGHSIASAQKLPRK